MLLAFLMNEKKRVAKRNNFNGIDDIFFLSCTFTASNHEFAPLFGGNNRLYNRLSGKIHVSSSIIKCLRLTDRRLNLISNLTRCARKRKVVFKHFMRERYESWRHLSHKNKQHHIRAKNKQHLISAKIESYFSAIYRNSYSFILLSLSNNCT